MRIAIVGCGDRCVRLMQIIDQYAFQEIHPQIVEVVDIDGQAPGIQIARQKGVPASAHYEDLLKRTDIDLIIELTGRDEVFNDILQRKSKGVRIISSQTVKLFWELSHVTRLQEKARKELNETRAKCKMILDELIEEDVMIINRDYTIADINKHLLNKLGLRREEAFYRGPRAGTNGNRFYR